MCANYNNIYRELCNNLAHISVKKGITSMIYNEKHCCCHYYENTFAATTQVNDVSHLYLHDIFWCVTIQYTYIQNKYFTGIDAYKPHIHRI